MKPILIRDEGGVQMFRDPEIGGEFSTTISTLVPNAGQDNRLVGVKCIIRAEGIAKQLAVLKSIPELGIAPNNRQAIADARAKGTVTVSGLRIWRAEQRVAEMKQLGFSAGVIRD
jgi:hypothetical protein